LGLFLPKYLFQNLKIYNNNNNNNNNKNNNKNKNKKIKIKIFYINYIALNIY